MNFLFVTIDWVKVLISVGIMVGIALLMGVVIVIVSKFFEIKGDSKVEEVKSKLSGANCGSCGFAGCEEFAKALVEGKVNINDCKATSKENKIEISNLLGVAFSGEEDTMAIVTCGGGINCQDKYEYQGYGDCISAQLLANGRKACQSGCLGSGSCVEVCPEDAIEIKNGVAHVNPDLCIGCGACINECPKKIIKRIPRSAVVYVKCANQNRGKDVASVCTAGCISCGLCQKNCPSGAIHIENNVPIIDYSKCVACKKCINVCPRKVIKLVRE
ncbi:MAG: RnfABCDGE type electron transport complex subunit B [Clostridia bacterium]